MRSRRIAGAVLLALSLTSVLQTAREVWDAFHPQWTVDPRSGSEFRFAGRTISVERPEPPNPAAGRLVLQERVRIDGVDVGAPTGLRMARWRLVGEMRSPHWFSAAVITDREGRDSSLWLVRRLQAADTVPPRFEVIVVDTSGRHAVHTYSQRALRRDERLHNLTYLVAERLRPDHPLSVTAFVWFPYLVLLFPIGTGIAGAWMLRR